MLSTQQTEYVTSITNTRGGTFKYPYGFISTQVVGAHADYLSIVVIKLADGNIHGGSVKDTVGTLANPEVTSPFEDLVDKVLTMCERHL